MSANSTELVHGDYTLDQNGAWFTLKGFAIRVHGTDEGVVVDIYANGREDEDAIASAYAFDAETEPDPA